MAVEVFKEFHFEAAHFLPCVPEEHKCRRMHGHSYRVLIYLTGRLGKETGWIMDFADLKTIVKPLIATLDHQILNDIAGLENPTVENVAIWLWNNLKTDLPLLSKVTVYETPTSGASYTE